jgi:hypothetical protein
MKTRIEFISIPVLVFALIGCAQSGGTPPASHAGHGASESDIVVQFTDSGIRPSVATFPASGRIAWTNMASEYNGVVAFPLDMANSFTCTDLRPQFSRTDTHIVSMPIARDMENVTLPCPLKGGEYEYQILLFRGAAGGDLGGLGNMYNPNRSLTGKLVVQ